MTLLPPKVTASCALQWQISKPHAEPDPPCMNSIKPVHTHLLDIRLRHHLLMSVVPIYTVNHSALYKWHHTQTLLNDKSLAMNLGHHRTALR